MIAIVSDIHGNQEALLAVLKDIHERGVEDIYCLGDITGYGPNPRECVDLIQDHAKVVLRGNHDDALFNDGASDFNLRAEGALIWAREQLFSNNQLPRDRQRRITYLKNLPETHEEDDLLFVHGSPRRPVNEYVFPDDVYTSPAKIHSLFERFGKLCFTGHTHVPGVFFDTPDFYSPDELENVYAFSETYKAMINVGSVGQPRDRDPRASYVLVDDKQARFIRVPYDLDGVVEKMRAIPELDEYNAVRLREGR